MTHLGIHIVSLYSLSYAQLNQGWIALPRQLLPLCNIIYCYFYSGQELCILDVFADVFPFLGMRWEDHPALFSFTTCKVTPGPITHCFLYSSWKSFSSIITWVTCLDWACQDSLVSPQEAYIQWEHQELMVTLQRLLYHLNSGQEEKNLSYICIIFVITDCVATSWPQYLKLWRFVSFFFNLLPPWSSISCAIFCVGSVRGRSGGGIGWLATPHFGQFNFDKY